MKQIAFLVLAMFAATANAQELVRQITVLGEAKDMVQPDQAVISFTIESNDRELAKVKQMQDAKLQQLYQMAGQLQIEKKNFSTRHSQLYPEYRYDKGQQHFVGYRSSVAITIALDQIDRAAEVIQALVEAKFDQIDQVRYRVKDDVKIRDELKLQALNNAKVKAEKMAAALGMKLGKPVQIQEAGASAPTPQPMMKAMAMAESDMMRSAPQAPPTGQEEIYQTVSVTFEMME